jgi:AraC-like DNA-binding protein
VKSSAALKLQEEPSRSARHLRTAEMAGSELSYVHTTSGAAPPDVRSLFEVILVDLADKTIVHRGVEQHIRTGLVGMRSQFEAGRLVRRHAPDTRVRVLAIGDDALASACEAADLQPNALPHVLTYLEDRALFTSASAVFSAVEAKEPALAVQSHLAACATQVIRRLTGREFRGRSPVDMTSAERIRAVLHDSVTEDVTLDDLAREVGLSRAYLVHAFQRAFQVPPYEYLMQLRVARARALLAAGERPIDVAHACGFCDQSHLNRWFRKVVGVTPGEYGARVSEDRVPGGAPALLER